MQNEINKKVRKQKKKKTEKKNEIKNLPTIFELFYKNAGWFRFVSVYFRVRQRKYAPAHTHTDTHTEAHK